MEDVILRIISLAKRRGFIYPSSEIYGGLGGFYDFGPLGAELKRNVKAAWWKNMVSDREDVVGLDSAIVFNPRVWQASGHVENFTDPLAECKKCHKRFRADHLMEDETVSGRLDEPGAYDLAGIKNIEKAIAKIKCPECGGELTPPRQFNLMFRTFIGPVEDTEAEAFLRPETAQGIFINYKNILDTQRVKVPFGIGQIGKAFRNEITPRNFIFRTREFEQMELEYFVKPGTDDKFFEYWVKERKKWYTEILGLKEDRLRIRPHNKEELAHYAKSCVDIEYKFPFGWGEIEGIANRTDFDLKQHQDSSGVDLRYFDDVKKEYFFPFVIEPSCGVERILFAILCDSYHEVEGGRTKTTQAVKNAEIVLRINKRLAPIQIAVLPLLKNKPELVARTKEIYNLLKSCFVCQYDETGSIGRRYRRADEIGIPFALTIDFETLDSDTVTVRDRDSMEQERVKINDLINYLSNQLKH